MLHDILDYDHLQWHPSLIRLDHRPIFNPITDLDLITEFDFLLNYERTFATGAACQQRTLTPPDTWSCPTLGLASVLMLRPISPELVLFPDFWVSNIPRYFCFLLWNTNFDAVVLNAYSPPMSMNWIDQGVTRVLHFILYLFYTLLTYS